MSSPNTSFEEATAVKALSSHTYEGNFPDDWCIGSVPHGGFVTSVFQRVATTHFSSTLSAQKQPHTIGLHLDFLRRTQSGPALFTVSDTKLGRQTSVIHITLSQSGRDEVIGSLTQANLASESGVSFDTNYALTPAPPPIDLAALGEDTDANWVRQGDMPFASFRKATLKTQFYFPREGQKSRSWADEWIRWNTGEKWTNASLGYVVDMFAMPVEAHIRKDNPYDVKQKKHDGDDAAEAEVKPKRFWYPTVLLNMDVKKALPEEGVEWLFSRTSCKQIKNGRMDLEIVVLDEGGEIVALSHHIALAVPSERNLAKRSDSKI